VPVGTTGEALAVLALIRPALPAAAASAAMLGTRGDGFVAASPKARWLDPVGWTRRGYAVSADALLTRSGILTRLAHVVPHARVQSMRLEQGALQRRAGVATVQLISTPGPVRPEVEHLDLPDATHLFNEQVARSAAARSAAARSA
jgi:putative membrane protein